MDWEQLYERERARYDDGRARPAPEQLLRLGNAAYGAGLSLLMLDRADDASTWLERAAARWRESWDHATRTSWGRPVGAIKAALVAGGDAGAAGLAEWALELGSETAESPIGRYAATLALLVLDRDAEAGRVASSLRNRADFPPDVAEALAFMAGRDATGYAVAVESVLDSFETRESYLEDVPVADTVIVLQRLASRRGLAAELPRSALLPG